MDSFPLPLIVRALDHEYDWEVVYPFYCNDPVLGRIDVPAGTVTDFGSIPRRLWSIISPVGIYREPYVIHDRLYSVQQFTQKQSDDCLLRGMKEKDILHKRWGVQRMTIYIHLRLYGWVVWRRHKKAKEKSNEK